MVRDGGADGPVQWPGDPAGRSQRSTGHEALARGMILNRFGTTLSSTDVDALVPYVVDDLLDAERLRSMRLATLDPRTTTLMDDGAR